MYMRKLWMSLLVLPLIGSAVASDIATFSKVGRFEDVRDDVVNAIEAQGIKINHSNHIAEMLARTGKDLGAARQVYVQGEQVEFCKSNLSRAQMEADPVNMVFCPYIISIYTTLDKPGVVSVAYRVPAAPKSSAATRKALRDVDALLKGIVQQALQ